MLCSCQSDLERAAKKGDTEQVKILLAGKTYKELNNLDKKDIDLAFAKAIQHGHIDTVKIFINTVEDINKVISFGLTPLMWAARKGNNDIIKVLVDGGADVNRKGGYPENPLWIAVRNHKTESVILLLDLGAEVNATSGGYFTALRTAAEYGYVDIVKILLQRGAMVDYSGRYSKTPLMCVMTSAFFGKDDDLEEVAKILINAGADINATDKKFGNTALMYAAGGKEIQLVRLLINSGADVNIKDKKGRSALWTPKRNLYFDIVAILKDAGAVE